MANFPRLLVISDSSLSLSHGTGTALARHLSAYPQDRIRNAYIHAQGMPLFSSRQWGVASRPKGIGDIARLVLRRALNGGLRVSGQSHRVCRGTITFLDDPNTVFPSDGFDLIYSVAYNHDSLALLAHIQLAYPKTPVIQYFMDFQMGRGLDRNRYLEPVVTHATELWALTEPITREVQPLASRSGKTVRLMPAFHLDIPETFKTVHRVFAAKDFRAIVFGNFWDPSVALLLKGVWQRLQQRHLGLGPIRWLAHETSVRNLEQAIGTVQPEIRPIGFMTGTELFAYLRDADLAILPFDKSAIPSNDYSRYSLPSRLTELLAVGLPVFAIASSTTPLAEYLNDQGLGLCVSGHDIDALEQQLAQFIRDRSHREQKGRSARAFAERHFSLVEFQKLLYGTFQEIASPPTEEQRPAI